MLIFVKKMYTIHGDLAKGKTSEKLELKHFTKNNSELNITIHPTDQIIETWYQTQVSKKFYQFLKNGEYEGVKILDEDLQKTTKIDKKIELALYEELSQMQSELTEISEKVFDYLKYFQSERYLGTPAR